MKVETISYRIGSLDKMLVGASKSKRRVELIHYYAPSALDYLRHTAERCKQLRIGYHISNWEDLQNLEMMNRPESRARGNIFRVDAWKFDAIKKNVPKAIYFLDCICDSCYHHNRFSYEMRALENLFGKENVYIGAPDLTRFIGGLNENGLNDDWDISNYIILS